MPSLGLQHENLLATLKRLLHEIPWYDVALVAHSVAAPFDPLHAG